MYQELSLEVKHPAHAWHILLVLTLSRDWSYSTWFVADTVGAPLLALTLTLPHTLT